MLRKVKRKLFRPANGLGLIASFRAQRGTELRIDFGINYTLDCNSLKKKKRFQDKYVFLTINYYIHNMKTYEVYHQNYDKNIQLRC